MALRMKVRIVDEVTPGLKRLRQKIPDALRDVIRGIAYDVRNSAMTAITSGPKTGHTYKRGGVSHQASAPGEAPASDTGDLLDHITVAARPRYTDVGAEVLHGLYMEEGTKTVEPRPWLLPSYEEHSGRIEAALIRELEGR